MTVTHEHATGHAGFFSEVAPITPMTEAAAGVAVVILAILGLANIASVALAAIAAIVVGGALIMQSASEATSYGQALAASDGGGLSTAEFGGGVAVEFLAGGAGVVLGILALLGIAALPLIAVALIIFGGVLLIGGGVAAGAGAKRIGAATADPALLAMARQAVGMGTAASVLIGLAGIVLGVLALVHLEATVLVLVGFLTVGAALLLRGASIAAIEASVPHK